MADTEAPRPENPFSHSDRTDELEARNRSDDARQDKADLRQQAAEDRLASNEQRLRVSEVTLRDLHDIAKDLRQDVRDGLKNQQFAIEQIQETFRVRFDSQQRQLRDMTAANKLRTDAVEQLVEADRLAIMIAIGKISPATIGAVRVSDLPLQLASELGRSKRTWAALIAVVVLLVPVIIDHWTGWIHQATNLPFGF
jgi:hypothetical protein